MSKIPIGRCPEHGIVTGDDVEYSFPANSRCARCGCGLITPARVDQEVVEEYVQATG